MFTLKDFWTKKHYVLPFKGSPWCQITGNESLLQSGKGQI